MKSRKCPTDVFTRWSDMAIPQLRVLLSRCLGCVRLTRTNQHTWLINLFACFCGPSSVTRGRSKCKWTIKTWSCPWGYSAHPRWPGWGGWQQGGGIHDRNMCLQQARSRRKLSFHLLKRVLWRNAVQGMYWAYGVLKEDRRKFPQCGLWTQTIWVYC